MTSSEPALAARALGKRYGDGKVALDAVDLRVEPGEIFGLLGPNGAGKSTAIQILTTLLAPTTGQARIFGRDVVREQDAVRRDIGVALQETGVDPLLTGLEAIELQARLYGASRVEARARASQLGRTLELEGFLRRRVATYSGGMRRRLDLALALVHRPRLIVLDEPTTGLDPLSRTGLWQSVRDVRAQAGATVFLSTQYLEEADALCDRVAILRAGRVVAEDTPARLKGRLGRDVIELVPADGVQLDALLALTRPIANGAERSRDAVRAVVRDGAGTVRDLLAAADAAGIALASVRVAPPSLDEVFLALTRDDGRAAEAGAARIRDARAGGLG